jgi:hypothetical protein
MERAIFDFELAFGVVIFRRWALDFFGENCRHQFSCMRVYACVRALAREVH